MPKAWERTRRRSSLLPGLGGSGQIVYLLRDEFITAAGAPLASPRTAEPGPGPLTIQDTAPSWSIAGGELTPSAANLGTNNPGIWHVAGFPRVTGRAFKSRVKNVSAFGADANKTFSPMVIWADTAGTGVLVDCEGISYWIANSKFQVFDSISGTAWTTIESCFADTYNVFVPILRAGGGMFHVMDSKLIAITRQNTDPNVHPNVASLGSSRNPPQVDYMRVADLGYPWNQDFGICATQLPGARSAADTFTHEGSCHIEFTITTLPASGTVEVRFRKQDANNYWRITLSSAGALNLDEVVAGTPTNRATIASNLANDRIVISMTSAAITFYRDRPASGVTNTTISTSVVFATQTTGEVNSLGTGGAIRDLYTYPYNLSGLALSWINAL